MISLHEKLTEYCQLDYYPFHMPGHKRNVSEKGAYAIDITEIDGFDNMHKPEGIIKDSLDRISRFYKSDYSYFLVNGSTAGLLSAISAATHKGGKILVARNCHKAVYNGIYLRDLMPVYVYPDYIYDGKYKSNFIYGGINPEIIYNELQNDGEIDAVIITSPTYEGIVSDVERIANICHKFNKPLIVDEAHGAHFGMNGYFPDSSLSKGADIVVQSLHKTLPSLTQTAIVHIKSKLVNHENLEKFLKIYQTTSPSYVFMDSMEKCIDDIFCNGETYFDEYINILDKFRNECKKFTHIKLMDSNVKGNGSIYDFDRSRLVFFVNSQNMSGTDLYYRLLHKYHIQMEMSAPGYIIGITSVKDTNEGFERLLNALTDIDRELRLGKDLSKVAEAYSIKDFKPNSIFYDNVATKPVEIKHKMENVTTEEDVFLKFGTMRAIVYERISDTDNKKKEEIDISSAIGKVSADYIYIYPPGVPIVAPGEIISTDSISLIQMYMKYGYNVHGLRGENNRQICVEKEDFKAVNITEVFGKKIFREIPQNNN